MSVEQRDFRKNKLAEYTLKGGENLQPKKDASPPLKIDLRNDTELRRIMLQLDSSYVIRADIRAGIRWSATRIELAAKRGLELTGKGISSLAHNVLYVGSARFWGAVITPQISLKSGAERPRSFRA